MVSKFIAAAAAVVVSATAAGAADLNKPARVAVDYVKVCDAYGAGFFYIPGSDTCLKIGGRVYQDFRVGNGVLSRISPTSSAYTTSSRTGSAVYSRSAMYLNLDARTNTEFGLLRSYQDYRLRFSTSGSNSATTEVDMDFGYIQWGGLTAGKTRSFFDFAPAGYTYNLDYGVFQTNTLLNVVGYTFALGNGVSLTGAIQDPTTADVTYNNLLRNETTGPLAPGTTSGYGALNIPDFVANLAIAQAWGSAQIAGAYHQDYSYANGSKNGYAFNAGIEFKLDQLAKGDKVAFQGGYAVGAQGFITALNSGSGNIGKVFRPGNYIGEDWAVDAGGSIRQTNTWGLLGSFQHNFSANYEFDFDASYLSVQGYGPRDEQAYGLQSVFLWKPLGTSNFSIGTALEYGAVNYSGATRAANTGLNSGRGIYNEQGWELALRVNRTF